MSDEAAGKLAAKWRAEARQYATWANMGSLAGDGGDPKMRPSTMLAAEAEAMRRCAEELEKAFDIGPPHDQPNWFYERFMWTWEQNRRHLTHFRRALRRAGA